MYIKAKVYCQSWTFFYLLILSMSAVDFIVKEFYDNLRLIILQRNFNLFKGVDYPVKQ